MSSRRKKRSKQRYKAKLSVVAPVSVQIAEQARQRGFSLIFATVALSIIGLMYTIMQPTPARGVAIAAQARHDAIFGRYATVTSKVTAFEASQIKDDIQLISPTAIQLSLSHITADIEGSSYTAANTAITKLLTNLSGWQNQLTSALAAKNAPPIATLTATPASTSHELTLQVPILIYHHPPSDMEAQLQEIQAKGYTTISLAQLADALHGAIQLPSKSVVITFDDGYSDQMTIVPLLEQYNMKATFYIITGGAASNWCIGADRRYDQAQPCGDGYLNWGQIQQIDQNPLFTIGVHTVDHLALATQTPATQQFEIDQSKQEIESELGHPVYDFAYPYGSYNQTTIALVEQAGFRTAVTTNPGTSETLDSIFTLPRVRSADDLP